MTFADLHVSIRALLRGTPFRTFSVTVESLELHPGRTRVEWRACVTDAIPPIFFRSQNPFEVLSQLRQRLARDGETVPPELAAVGSPPPEEDLG